MLGAWIPDGSHVLDIGCFQGAFLEGLGDRIGPSVGVDPLASPKEGGRHRVLPEPFRKPFPFPDAAFDAIVLLATREHIREGSLGLRMLSALTSGSAREHHRPFVRGSSGLSTCPAACV